MGTRTLWSCEVELAAELVSASRSRGFVRRHLSLHGLALLSDHVELVVSELATNAVLHAETPFTVSLHAFEDTLLLEVEDGAWTGPCQAVFAEPDAVSGRGLSIVTLLSRDWGVDAHPGGGKSVWVEFGLP
jgi:anti-sigma regulatory factor (Ser/Thr protein kinase)